MARPASGDSPRRCASTWAQCPDGTGGGDRAGVSRRTATSDDRLPGNLPHRCTAHLRARDRQAGRERHDHDPRQGKANRATPTPAPGHGLGTMATHDSLTGLPNRTVILDRTEQMLVRSRRNHKPVSALFIDLDNFNAVNDTLGHDTG